MKLYAVRDRLIDYYLRAFTAEGDKDVLASLSEAINNVENKTPIAQTPHHFEIWRLGEIDQETGIVVPSRELLATCESLIRGDLRETVDRRRAAIDKAARGQQGALRGPGGDAGARGGPIQDHAQTTPGAGAEADSKGAGGPPGTR